MTQAYQDSFERAFALTVGEEGVFSTDRGDNGNWTGGRVGVGEFRGTKFGISAAAYPQLDIEGLTLDRARAIYRADYWSAIRGDELPPVLALAAFDAVVNHGPGSRSDPRTLAWLQAAVGAAVDGVLGPRSLAAAAAVARDPARLARALDDFHAARLRFMAAAETWPRHGLGWAGRVLRVNRRLTAAAGVAGL